MTVTPKDLNTHKIIAAILSVVCALWIAAIVIAVVFIASMIVGNFGFGLTGVFVLYAGLANVPIVILMLVTAIWEIILFVRYIRLCQNKLKISLKRLWIETILVNALSLLLLYFVQTLSLPYSVRLASGIWSVLVMLLAGAALGLRIRQAA